jgi:hypothetical protein
MDPSPRDALCLAAFKFHTHEVTLVSITYLGRVRYIILLLSQIYTEGNIRTRHLRRLLLHYPMWIGPRASVSEPGRATSVSSPEVHELQ